MAYRYSERSGCDVTTSTSENRPSEGLKVRPGWLLTAAVALNTVRTRFELWLLGYRWARRMIAEPRDELQLDNNADIDACRTLLAAVEDVGKRLNATTFVRCLTAQRMLCQRGVLTELRIGIHHDTLANRFTTRTWLERRGEIFNDDPELVGHFRVLEDGRTPFH